MSPIVELRCLNFFNTDGLEGVLRRLVERPNVGLQLFDLSMVLGLTVSLYPLNSGFKLDCLLGLELAANFRSLSLVLVVGNLLLSSSF